MRQLLLFDDPRPLVDLLGVDFFRQAPTSPGVYLMRDAADQVLYVGKANNLRKRLASYRVANPARMQRRHLRLLRSVSRIELQSCASETAAIAREAALLRTLRPRFNRAGTWPGARRFVAWRICGVEMQLAVTSAPLPAWNSHGPMGASAYALSTSLLRLLWCALRPDRGIVQMPVCWFSGRSAVSIWSERRSGDELRTAAMHLDALFAGEAGGFSDWVREQTAAWQAGFGSAVRDVDLELIQSWSESAPHRVFA